MARALVVWPQLPNAITCMRVAMVPLVVLLLVDQPGGSLAAAAIFALAAASDALDGHLARSRDLVSTFGKIADPLADKLLIGSILVALTTLGRLALWIVAVVLLRELAVSGLRALAARHGAILAARPLGKLKMAMQAVAVLLLLAVPDPGGTLVLCVVYVTVAVTIVSGLQVASASWRAVAGARTAL